MDTNSLRKYMEAGYLNSSLFKNSIIDIEKNLSPGSSVDWDEDFYVSFLEREYPNGVIEREKRFGHHRHIHIHKGY